MNKVIKSIRVPLIVLLSFQLVSCGSILYPERRNKTPGRIDVGVALLDGFWLLLGILPGVIAFAVDFATGAIYIPSTKTAKLDFQNARIVRFDPNRTSTKELEEIIRKETASDFHFSDKRLQLTHVRKNEVLAEIKAEPQS